MLVIFDHVTPRGIARHLEQNLKGRKIALIVLSTPQWPVVRVHLDRIVAAVDAAVPGGYVEVLLR